MNIVEKSESNKHDQRSHTDQTRTQAFLCQLYGKDSQWTRRIAFQPEATGPRRMLDLIEESYRFCQRLRLEERQNIEKKTATGSSLAVLLEHFSVEHWCILTNRPGGLVMPDRVGQQIGNYRLVKLLGKGGFAEVYLGQHVHLASKQAAIKLLHLIDVDARKFQEEAETTEKLVHPHIVRLLDFAIEEGTPFLVLDYAPGGSLRTCHPKGSIVPLERVGRYLKELAPALQYAHDLHILHRDIKPDNMLIGRGGELLVSDFGIAVLTQTGRTSLSSAYDIGGTPYYMAPETYQGKPVKESDQYALAVVVYEWLCGSVPFSQGNFIQLGYQHAYNPVPPLREKNPAISPIVEAVIKKALSKEPKDRFASVQTFVEAFEQACILTLPAEKPQSGQGIPDKQTPLDQSSHQQGREQPSKPSGVQPLQPIQDETGIKITPRSVPPRVTPVGRTEQPPLEIPVVTPPSQSAVSTEKATLPNQSLLPTEPATPPRSLVEPTVPAPPPSHSIEPTVPATSSLSVPPLSLPRWRVSDTEPVAEPEPFKRRLSRRTAVTGIAVFAGIVTVGGVIWGSAPHPHPFYTYTGPTAATSIAWSPDSKRLASAYDNAMVHLWNADGTGTPFIYTGQPGSIKTVAWSPDSKRLASGSSDTISSTVQVWNADGTGTPFTYGKNELNDSNIVGWNSVAWSPDGKHIASATFKEVHLWNADGTGTPFIYTGHSDSVNSVAWSPGGKRIASASEDGTVQVWNADGSGTPFIFKSHFTYDFMHSAAWSPDGKRLASASYEVQVWNADGSGTPSIYGIQSIEVNSVAWSPDGKQLASALNDNTVKIWNVADRSNSYTYFGHSNQVNAVVWSPDGKWLASASNDKTVQVWKPE